MRKITHELQDRWKSTTMGTCVSPFGLVRASPTFDERRWPRLASLSNRAASDDARHLLPDRWVEQTSRWTQAPSRWLGCRVLRGNVCTNVTTMSRLNKWEWTGKWFNQVICVPSSRREWSEVKWDWTCSTNPLLVTSPTLTLVTRLWIEYTLLESATADTRHERLTFSKLLHTHWWHQTFDRTRNSATHDAKPLVLRLVFVNFRGFFEKMTHHFFQRYVKIVGHSQICQ